MKFRHLIIFISFFSLLSFTKVNYERTLEGTYYGTWASTQWVYQFYKNNTFYFRSFGHFGFTKSSGEYKIKGDTVILNSTETDSIEKEIFYQIKNAKFLIDGDSCIIDCWGDGYDYCKTDFVVKKYHSMDFRNSRERNKK